MTWIKVHWKLLFICLVTIMLLLWIDSVTGTSRKFYDMMLDQLRTDQSQIIKDKEAWIKDCEDEIKKLAQEKVEIQKEKLAVQRQSAESAKEVARLKGKIDELQKKIDSIVVSSNPDDIISDLNKMGYGPIHRH